MWCSVDLSRACSDVTGGQPAARRLLPTGALPVAGAELRRQESRPQAVRRVHARAATGTRARYQYRQVSTCTCVALCVTDSLKCIYVHVHVCADLLRCVLFLICKGSCTCPMHMYMYIPVHVQYTVRTPMTNTICKIEDH